MSYPPQYLCAMSGQLMTTPVVLTATGQCFELSALSSSLRLKPLTDPLTGRPIASNSMEINFALQAEIEDYVSGKGSVSGVSECGSNGGGNGGGSGGGVPPGFSLSCLEEETLPSHSLSPLNHSSRTTGNATGIPTAPPVDFALSFMSEADDDGIDKEELDYRNQNDYGVPYLSCLDESDDDNDDVIDIISPDHIVLHQHDRNSEVTSESIGTEPSSHTTPPREDVNENLTSQIDQIISSFESFPEELELPPHTLTNPPTTDNIPQKKFLPDDVTNYLEEVSFKGNPVNWKYTRGNTDVVSRMLSRDNNEYTDRRHLNKLSTNIKRAKALSRRYPIMWGFETELKSSPQAIVSIMNSMNNPDDEHEEYEKSPDKFKGPLGPPGPPSPPGPRSRSSNNFRGGGGINATSAVGRCGKEGGNTALHVAVWNGHLPVVVCLVEAGANLDVKNANNCTPLMLGCRFGHFEIAKYLLEHGAAFRAIRKVDICCQGKMDDEEVKKKITGILNASRKKAGLSHVR
jgi:hypothetical protein